MKIRLPVFHQHALHEPAFGPGLMRDQRHAEDLLGDGRDVIESLRDFDTATFAAAAGVNLRLDYDAAADFLRRSLRFSDGKRHFPARHGDMVFGQNGLGLILVDFHLVLPNNYAGI